MNVISAILLAAGQSKRIRGENKLLKKYKGKILINHILKSLIKSKANKIIIVLGYEDRKIKKIALKSKKIIFVFNSNYARGISTSIKCGIKKISKKNIGFLIAHADSTHPPETDPEKSPFSLTTILLPVGLGDDPHV